ncbi:MAG: hypothetical protein ACREQ5_01675 [Candidatus Dormibacteria bacterium]
MPEDTSGLDPVRLDLATETVGQTMDMAMAIATKLVVSLLGAEYVEPALAGWAQEEKDGN